MERISSDRIWRMLVLWGLGWGRQSFLLGEAVIPEGRKDVYKGKAEGCGPSADESGYPRQMLRREEKARLLRPRLLVPCMIGSASCPRMPVTKCSLGTGIWGLKVEPDQGRLGHREDASLLTSHPSGVTAIL